MTVLAPEALLVCGIAAIGISACGGTAERQPPPPADTVAEAEPAPPETPNENYQPASNVETDESGDEFIVHGVCPFECCKYGTWTLLQGGVLRSAPRRGADSVGKVDDGATVSTDQGVMVLHPPGIAVVVPDTGTHNSSGPAIGDTVEVITYTGAKVSRVRWHDQELEMSWGALQMTREPLQRWWVHMTDPNSGAGGWLQMGGVRSQDVGAPNSCNKAK